MVNIKNSPVPPAQELETFLPGSGGTNGSKYKITPATKKDLENGGESAFDPFKERQNPNPTTDGETVTHLLKASLGTGILAMPIAFMNSGLVLGIFATILTALVCTHCSYILVKCAHALYRRTHRCTMSFAETAEQAFLNGPAWGRVFARFSRVLILQCLFWTYFGTCSVYTVIIATNFQQIAVHYYGSDIDLRIFIAGLLVPLILLCYIPNLKYLAPVSMIANGLMGVGLLITFYYLVQDLPPPSARPMVAESLLTLPAFFSITIFAMEAIGVVMPLENAMKTPQNFVGICGVLNRGMSGVTLVYILLGFLGYLRYGDETKGSITLNLPVEEIPAQIVKVVIALAVYCTFGLQFFVCLEIVWDGIKDRFVNRPLLVNYVTRTVLVTAAVLLACAVPTISPFIGLIGAFCFSILGLLVPVAIESVTFWEQGFGKGNWIVWKNVLVVAFGIFALVFGSKSAIEDILAMYIAAPVETAVAGVEVATVATTTETVVAAVANVLSDVVANATAATVNATVAAVASTVASTVVV